MKQKGNKQIMSSEEEKTQQPPYYSREQMNDSFDKEWYEENNRRNEYFLDLFYEDMQDAGLSSQTYNKHYSNVQVFLDMLGSREGWIMEECLEDPGQFLGNWFVRRCMWSTPANIKTTATSIKKFAKCMLDHKIIEKDDYKYLCDEIKDNLPEWQDNCAWYNNSGMDLDQDEFIRRFGMW